MTRHAAQALGPGRARRARAGPAADFVVWNVGALEELGYWIGFNPRAVGDGLAGRFDCGVTIKIFFFFFFFFF